jgi:LmbE family N-acetylglucosaminyl deacetylase
MSIHELFITAHPDDEVIGAGGQFATLAAPLFVQVTDGAPRDMLDAIRSGFDVACRMGVER